MLSGAEITAFIGARAPDPYALLGMHERGGRLWVTTLQPHARTVVALDADGAVIAALPRIHPDGLFDGIVAERGPRFPYRLRVDWDGSPCDLDDPYRLLPLLGATDAWLIAEGSHQHLADVLVAHLPSLDGVAGYRFAVWAPNALRVSVVGDFNHWGGRRHPMRLRRECGVWEIFVPAVSAGNRYKFELLGASGELLSHKADPVAFAAELRPATDSIVSPPRPPATAAGPPATCDL